MARIGQVNPSFQEDKWNSENSVNKKRRQKRENAFAVEGTYKAEKIFYKHTGMDKYLLSKYAPDEDEYRLEKRGHKARVTGEGEVTHDISSTFSSTLATAVSRRDGSRHYLSYLEFFKTGDNWQEYNFGKNGLTRARVKKAHFDATWEVNANGILERTAYSSSRKRDGHLFSTYSEKLGKPIAGTDGLRKLVTKELPKVSLLGPKEKIYEVDKYGNRERISRTTRFSSFEKTKAQDGLSSAVAKSRWGFSKSWESQFDERGREIGRKITSNRRLLNERTAKFKEDGSLQETEHNFGKLYSKKVVYKTGIDGREFKDVTRSSLFNRRGTKVPVELTAAEKLSQEELVSDKARLKRLQQKSADASVLEALSDVRSRASAANSQSTAPDDTLQEWRIPTPVQEERAPRTYKRFTDRSATPFRSGSPNISNRDSIVGRYDGQRNGRPMDISEMSPMGATPSPIAPAPRRYAVASAANLEAPVSSGALQAQPPYHASDFAFPAQSGTRQAQPYPYASDFAFPATSGTRQAQTPGPQMQPQPPTGRDWRSRGSDYAVSGMSDTQQSSYPAPLSTSGSSLSRNSLSLVESPDLGEQAQDPNRASSRATSVSALSGNSTAAHLDEHIEKTKQRDTDASGYSAPDPDDLFAMDTEIHLRKTGRSAGSPASFAHRQSLESRSRERNGGRA